MLSKFFKPKWQHSNPAVRAAAITKLQEDSSDQYQILRNTLINDTAVEVRTAALDKISSTQHLIELLEHPKLLDAKKIEDKLISQLNEATHPESITKALFDSNNRDTVLVIILKSKHSDLHSQALESIASQQQLKDIALSDAPISLRRQAADKLQDNELLSQLLKASRQKDKTIYRLVRDKVEQIKQHQAEQAQLITQRDNLLQQIETLQKNEWFPLFKAKLDSLSQDWHSLPEAITAEVKTRFDALKAQCLERIEELNQQEKQRQAEMQAALDAQQDLESLAESYKGLINDADQHLAHIDELDSARFIEDFDKENQALQADWQRLSSFANQTQQAALETAQKTLEQRVNLVQNYHAAITAIDTLLQQEDLTSQVAVQTAKQAKANINWPSHVGLPERLIRLDQVIAQANRIATEAKNQSKTLAANLKDKLEALESAIDQGAVKQAEKYARRSKQLLSELTTSIPDHLKHKQQQLDARLQELRDWQGYAVVPKKEQLCAKMEDLVDTEIDLAQKSKLIQNLQKEWKLLDSTDPFHSQAIWNRFKTAADAAFEPCADYFAQQAKLRKYNLEQRTLIISELKNYLDSIDWEEDSWREIEKIINAAKQEWRRFVPVDRSTGNKLQEQFNQLTKSAEAEFKTFKERAKQAKQALIDQAAELAESEDIQQAAHKIKHLQKEWRSIGPTFHSLERKFWSEFRAHCDQIFARLKDEQPKREQQQREQEAQAKEEQAQNFLNSRAVKDFNAQVQQLKVWENAILTGQDADLKDDLRQQLSAFSPAGLYKEQLDLYKQTLLGLANQSLDIASEQAKSEQTLRLLCIRLEIALKQNTPEADQALRMEYQMQRLEQGFMQQSTEHNVEDLWQMILEWQSSALHQNFANSELEQRFNQLRSLVEQVNLR